MKHLLIYMNFMLRFKVNTLLIITHIYHKIKCILMVIFIPLKLDSHIMSLFYQNF